MSDSGGGSFPNREHYLKASLIGGGAAAVLSLVPVINWLNMFFFALVIVGGAIGVYWAQKKSGSIEVLEGATIGALSGLVCGLILFVLGFCGVSAFSLLVVPDMSSHETKEFMTIMTAAMGLSCCGSFTVYPVFAGLGGLIATLIWPPDAQAAAGPKAEPTPEQRAKRKKMMQIVGATLAGCLVLCLIFCGISGYLVYLQSRDPEDTAGQEAVVETPIQVGQPQTFEIPPAGTTDWTDYGIWIVSDDGDLPVTLFSLEGRIGCRQNYGYGASREPFMSQMYTYRGRDDGEPSWALVDTTYSYSDNGISCAFQVDELPTGVSRARIVVTRVERPFD